MAEPVPIVEEIAQRLIAECRRDIAAAELDLAAMRRILAGSRWLVAKWDERRREDAVTGGIRLPAYDALKASGFVTVEEQEEPRRRRRKRRALG